MSQSADTQQKNAQYFIDHLKLFKLPNEMYLGELYEATDKIQASQGERKASSGVYCLYEGGVKVDFHTLEADEILMLIYGCSLDVVTINPDGTVKKEVLGYNLEQGERPQIVIPRKALFAVVNSHTDRNTFSLITAFTSPGYDQADSVFPSRADLTSKYPQHKDLIENYTASQ